jgi:hypothetical protein
MKLRNYVTLLCFSFCAGILMLCILQEWIIIRFPHFIENDTTAISQLHRSITLCRWHAHRWHTETVPIITTDDLQECLGLVVAAWLSMVQEEQMIPIQLSLQSVLCSAHNDIVYLSFSDTLVQQNKPTIDNLLCIEALLRTIKENAPPSVHSCFFLVNQIPMHDHHLDFSVAWPIAGFLHKS